MPPKTKAPRHEIIGASTFEVRVNIEEGSENEEGYGFVTLGDIIEALTEASAMYNPHDYVVAGVFESLDLEFEHR